MAERREQSAIRKFHLLKWGDRLLLAESLFVLALASLLVAFLPFRRIARIAAWKTGITNLSTEERRSLAKRIRWAISAVAHRVPWKAVCFQQGLAAQFMLRRRGIPSVLYYGAAPDGEKGLSAHVWIRDGDVDVIGGEIADRFAILAKFPATPVP
jgi:hypothetical protein